MTEAEMRELLKVLEERDARRSHREKRSGRRLALRCACWVGFVGVCGGVGYLMHVELAYKGFEFIGAAITDRVLFLAWE